MDTDTKLEVFIAKVSEWMDTTTEYRKSLCKKIDDINAKFNDLPCKERKSIYESVKNQLAIIWVVIGGIILAVFGEWIKGR